MTGLRRALIALGAAGVACGLGALALVIGSDYDHDQLIHTVFGPLIAWSFIGTGLYAWWQRSDNNFGPLMTAVGFTWLAGALSDAGTPGVFIAGELLGALPIGILIHLLLAYPEGRLRGRTAKGLALFAYFETTVVQVATVLVHDTRHADSCPCTPNPLLITHDKGIEDAFAGFQSVTSTLGLIVIVAFLRRRWRTAPPAQRRTLGPVYLAGAFTLVLLALTLTADVTSFDDQAEAAIDLFELVTLLAIPFAFLAGLMRTQIARGGGVSDLITRVGARDHTSPREMLADALEDPTLELAYWLPEPGVYVSEDGREVELPSPGSGRSVTMVERDGGRVAAIVHDRSLDDSLQLVRGAGTAVALALENARLDAELRARLEELRASRERLVRAGLEERRRLERDLHDGAQQRLVSLRLALALARKAHDPERSDQLVDAAMEELDAALAELRELARGIHPGVLTDHGLEPALAALADRAPLPVYVEAEPDRLPAAVESAAYFTVAEALTNVAKYAQAEEARVRFSLSNGRAVIEVRDDGVGGADPRRGTGLSGLSDRLAALGGALEVESPAGGGTVVRAEIPCV